MKEPRRYSSLSLLFYPFRVEILEAVERARAAGYPVAVFETYRSLDRQSQLYNQGRTTPGKIVTNAKPGSSWHNYGLAVDIALYEDKRWSWDFKPSEIAKYFESDLLIWGGTFKNFDGPHYEWKLKPSLEQAKAIVARGGILSLWANCEALSSFSEP
jgi:hypothetical protein